MTRLLLIVASSSEEFDPNTVTPGVVGFIITFLVAAATVFLVVDMTRRVRRTRYRSEVREQLDAEEEQASIDRAEAEFEAETGEQPGELPPAAGPDPRR